MTVLHTIHDEVIEISNGIASVSVAKAFGPRVLGYRLADGENAFGRVPEELGYAETSFGDRWYIRGGHRLWYAPEHAVQSYYPDNADVVIERRPRRLTVIQPIEPGSGVRKSITVELAPLGSAVRVTHRLEHCGERRLELAPWALTVMAPGGVAIIPQPTFAPHPAALAPARTMVLWPFTRMNDPRWTWGQKYILLRQDAAHNDAQKVGLYNEHGYMAYRFGQHLFLKFHPVSPGPHADRGCNCETFTNAHILELESLGPLVTLAPGQMVSHIEYWVLYGNVTGFETEFDIAAQMPHFVERARADLRQLDTSA